MPSLLVHIFAGVLIAYLLKVRRKSILLFGAILPDIKIFLYLVATPLLGISAANSMIIPIHSPFGSLLLCVFFAVLLPKKEFRKNLSLLCLGIAAHYALDASIFPFYGIEHYLLLYPFSWQTFGIETKDMAYLYVLNVLGLLFLSALAYNKVIKRHIKNQGEIT